MDQQTKSCIPASSLFEEDVESKDFVTRWGFLTLCDFVVDPEFEEYIPFNPSNVKKGDVLFLRGIYAPHFFEKVEPLIQVPYVILSHGFFKDAFKEEYLPYLERPNLIAWFGAHPANITHKKFHPIPLGVNSPNSLTFLARKEYTPESFCKAIERYSDIFKQLRSLPKENLLYSNFTQDTHEDRAKVAALLNDKEFCLVDQPTERVRYLEHMFCLTREEGYYRSYLERMAACKFVLSPRGAGIDCYRNWAALLAGCIPILLDCQLSPLFEELPVLLITKWEDLTEEFLNYHYERIMKKQYSLKKLYCAYWKEEINRVKKEFFQK